MRPLVRAEPEILDRRWRLLSLRTSREVEATADQLWAVIGDHTTWTTWHEDYEEHEATTAQSTGNGARFATKEWIFRYESEMVRWEPGEAVGLAIVRAGRLRWLIRSYYSEIRIEQTTGEPSRCRVEYAVAFTGTWLFWLLAAYTVGHSLGIGYLDARSSLRKLDRYVTRRERDGS